MYARVEDAWYPKAACAVCGAESMFQCIRLVVCLWLVIRVRTGSISGVVILSHGVFWMVGRVCHRFVRRSGDGCQVHGGGAVVNRAWHSIRGNGRWPILGKKANVDVISNENKKKGVGWRNGSRLSDVYNTSLSMSVKCEVRVCVPWA